MLKKVLVLLILLAVGLGLLLLTTRSSHYGYQSSAMVRNTPEQVWVLLADIDRWPSWWPGVERAKLLGPLAVGSRIELKLHGLPEEEPMTLDRVVPLQQLGWSGAGVLGSEVETRLELKPGPEGTEVSLANAIRGPQAVLARFTSGDSFSQYQQLFLKILERRLLEAAADQVDGEKD